MKAICLFPECATVYPTLLTIYAQRAIDGRMDDQKEILDESMQNFGGTDEQINAMRDMFKDYAHLIVQRDRLQLVAVDQDKRTALDLYVIAKRERDVLDGIRDIVSYVSRAGARADTTHRRTCDICNKSHKNL